MRRGISCSISSRPVHEVVHALRRQPARSHRRITHGTMRASLASVDQADALLKELPAAA